MSNDHNKQIEALLTEALALADDGEETLIAAMLSQALDILNQRHSLDRKSV